MRRLPHSWFANDAVTLAPKILGKIIRKGSCEGIIIETEAYTTDSASHAHHPTPRSAPMRNTYGHWYVYFTYGMHHCINITTNKGSAGAVLIRAIEPTKGIAYMKRRRGISDIYKLTNGPAKLCKAFGIDRRQNSTPIAGDFAIYDAPEIKKEMIATSPRIGIRNGTDLPWRFYIRDNSFVSGTRT